MFCKFCGKQVDPSSRVCPYCGTSQEARTGGNGFWDILGKEPVQSVPQTTAKPMGAPTYEGSARKEHKSKGVSSRVLLPVVVLGIVCTVILGVVELSALGTLKKEMTAALQRNETAIQALEKETATAAQKNETAIRTLEEKMKPLTEKLGGTQPSEPVVFLRAPQNAVLVNGTAAVSVEVAEGISPLEIQWEYKLGESEWKPVEGNSAFTVTENGTTLQITVPGDQNLDAACVRCYVQVNGKMVYSQEATITASKG